ncbi:MAG: nucleotidyltransferase [Mucilaginibacter sp.]|uniref:HI0074 family nucleotidyltransferase substrate-binding subunit n=1 Tax=Mucilaginibacter sp. TaxID=1882438 RepID=UPI002636ABA1|nr:HI0074 family nucleotidyltransferase substrate-binding subunit [Mucilaginibacter sp.]MDB5004508.1 nucleotidyltransferase [Mucilaginibacter sp.]
MENKDVHWKKQFQSFEKAFLFFTAAVEIQTYTLLEASGLVRSLESTFLLALKTIKDLLQEQGLTIIYPKEIIKEAFQNQIIDNDIIWIHMLEKRGEIAYTYDEAIAQKAVEIINSRYYKAIEQVYKKLKHLS